MRVPRETEENEDQQNWALTEGKCWELGCLMAVWEMGALRERVIKSDRMSRGESGPLTMVWRGSSYYCCTLSPPKTEWLKTTIILLFPTVCVCQAFRGNLVKGFGSGSDDGWSWKSVGWGRGDVSSWKMAEHLSLHEVLGFLRVGPSTCASLNFLVTWQLQGSWTTYKVLAGSRESAVPVPQM